VQERVLDSTIDQDVLFQEIISYHHQHTVIVTFSNQPRSAGDLVVWNWALMVATAPGKILHSFNAGGGFMYIMIDAPTTMHCLLLASSHRLASTHLLASTTTIYQEWVPAFIPYKTCGVILPIWITLRLLPLEYIDHALALASMIGQIFSVGEAPLYIP
jgi:hypothetical protein